MAGSSPFNVIIFFLTEFAEFSENHLGSTPLNPLFHTFTDTVNRVGVPTER